MQIRTISSISGSSSGGETIHVVGMPFIQGYNNFFPISLFEKNILKSFSILFCENILILSNYFILSLCLLSSPCLGCLFTTEYGQVYATNIEV